jgi:hypothetical protein
MHSRMEAQGRISQTASMAPMVASALESAMPEPSLAKGGPGVAVLLWAGVDAAPADEGEAAGSSACVSNPGIWGDWLAGPAAQLGPETRGAGCLSVYPKSKARQKNTTQWL